MKKITKTPELTITEEDTGAVIVEGWADDIKKHEQSIKALVKRNAIKKQSELVKKQQEFVRAVHDCGNHLRRTAHAGHNRS